jgi:hypothetical protein
MPNDPPLPPLKFLHSEDRLIPSKLVTLERLSTENLVLSLAPGQEHCLKTRPDGTIIDGTHLIYILRSREVDVDALPRDIISKQDL